MRERNKKSANRPNSLPTWQKYPQVLSFLDRASGSTAAEYAILLALVVTGIFIAGQTLSHAMRNTFDEHAIRSSIEANESNSLTAGEFLLEEVEAESTWIGAYAVMWERSAMLLLLISCFCLVRRQRKVVQEDVAAKEKAQVQSHEQLQVYLKRQQIYHTLSSKMDSLFNSQVQVQDLMSKRVTTVKPQIQVSRMKHLMLEKQVRHLIVCDESQRLIGIISDRDLHCTDSLTAEQVMTRVPITVPPDALVSSVISLMLKEQISSVPIVQEGRIQGLMTTTDLIMAMQCALQLWRQIAEELGVTPSHEPQKSAEEAESVEAEELALMSV